MKIINARLITEDGLLENAVIQIEKDRITNVNPDLENVPFLPGDIDARGWIVSPGWIDIQINGGFGMDFTTDPAGIWEVAAKLPCFGITGFLPTIITSSQETYQKAISIFKNGPPRDWTGARPFGWHFEGPFLNPERKGAHNPAYLRLPDGSFIKDWTRENGVMVVTMAPELPGAYDISARLAANGVILSAGHTAATVSEARQAIENGFSAATHLFNAMPPLNHRSPGIICEVLLNDRIYAGLIADGLHVHPKMIELAWRMKGARQIVLVSDAVGALGVQPGKFVQGGMEIFLDGNSARLADGTLAGSVLGLDQALRNVMKFSGSRLEEVIPALSRNQAGLLKLEKNGEIRPGFFADLTFIDNEGKVKMTMVAGKVVYP